MQMGVVEMERDRLIASAEVVGPMVLKVTRQKSLEILTDEEEASEELW